MDNRETLTPSSGDAILKRHLFSEVARNWIKGRGHIERAYFVRRPSRQSFGFRVAASSGPIPKAPGPAGGYLPPSRLRRVRWNDSNRGPLAKQGRLTWLRNLIPPRSTSILKIPRKQPRPTARWTEILWPVWLAHFRRQTRSAPRSQGREPARQIHCGFADGAEP